jgi:hypothetical protein
MSERPVCGPICEECGKPRDYLVPILVKRERFGKLEMVKIHLCFYHFMKTMEEDDEPDPTEKQIPEDEDDEEAWREWEDHNDEEEEEEDDKDEGWNRMCNVDRTGQSFG